MDAPQLAIEVLRILANTSIGPVSLAIALIFRKPLSELLTRVARIKFKDAELTIRDQASVEPDARALQAPMPSLDEPEEREEPFLLREFSVMRDSSGSSGSRSESRKTKPRKSREALLEESKTWHYLFLNGFLVPRTKFVLGFLATSNPPLTRTRLDDLLREEELGLKERTAIVEALSKFGLVEIDEAGVIRVSEKGEDYLKFNAGMAAGSSAWEGLSSDTVADN
ncbi:MAG: hypothetical protein AAGN66_17920 [Acidobacteriota bacterium]